MDFLSDFLKRVDHGISAVKGDNIQITIDDNVQNVAAGKDIIQMLKDSNVIGNKKKWK